MSISCGCVEGGEWWYLPPGDFSTFTHGRKKRCCSCKEPIACGDTVGEFARQRPARGAVEEKIFGDHDVKLASMWMCERCTGLYFSIGDRGFCVCLPADMRLMAAGELVQF
jgi:hypothetical protein